MKRRIQTSAVAAMFDAVKKLDTKPEHEQARRYKVLDVSLGVLQCALPSIWMVR
jgi:hypothetical protein